MVVVVHLDGFLPSERNSVFGEVSASVLLSRGSNCVGDPAAFGILLCMPDTNFLFEIKS